MDVYDIIIQDPWFGLVVRGEKTVEGRVGALGDKGWFVAGAIVRVCPPAWVVGSPVVRRVTAVRHYPTLAEYLTAEWRTAAPQTRSLDEAIAAYLAVELPGGGAVFAPERIASRGGIVAVEWV